jgi:hypothetical protein
MADAQYPMMKEFTNDACRVTAGGFGNLEAFQKFGHAADEAIRASSFGVSFDTRHSTFVIC